MKESQKYIVEIVAGTIILIGVIFYAFYFKVDDLKNVRRAEITLVRLREIRIALEKFYQETGSYPDLTREGAKDNLKSIVGRDKNGKKVYFYKIYGQDKLAPPLPKKSMKESNRVFNVQDFKNGTTGSGGWNYNYTEKTGEIHANLSDNYYLQGIIWSEE